MHISLSWINDFVKIDDIALDDLAYDFTMATAEVEGVIESGAYLSQVQTAKIESIRRHPEADKLNLVTVNLGQDKTKEVVCGAANVKEGLLIAYAPVGTTLPAGFTLEPKKIRGVLSEGMICSKEELALEESSGGIWELPENTQIGLKLGSLLEQSSDTLLDIDNKSLTHRPDLWGHFGLAREFAAITKRELQNPFNQKWQDNLENKFDSRTSPICPQVDTDSSCLIYWGLSLENVEVKESPKWMQQKLNDLGMRPINNIVDISNYVMLELGIPLHIFDRDLIEDSAIKIHKMAKEENFTTLDEIERSLTTNDTVISDGKKPLVLGGIMGGANSGVNSNTTNVFIEVANWIDHEVRKTSTRLGLRTESSQRYEKCLDSKLCYRTLLRTLDLLLESCPNAKVVGKAEVDGVHARQALPELHLSISTEKIQKVLGKNIPASEIISIFKSLDFQVEGDTQLKIKVPSYRSTKDIDCEADLIEEIGRMIGYDNIQEVPPLTAVLPVRLSPEKTMSRKIQTFLSNQTRALEIMTHPLIGKKLLEKALWHTDNDDLHLVNALSVDADRMRPSLIPGALQAASLNTKNYSSFSFFEQGRSYLSEQKSFAKEHNQVLIALYDKKDSRFVELIEQVENLLESLGLNFQITDQLGKFDNPIIPKSWIGVHPNENLHIRLQGKFEGAITTIHPLVMKNFKMKGNLHIAVIDLNSVESRPVKDKTKYTPLSKFPLANFDCSVTVGIKTLVDEVLDPVRKLKIKELQSIKVVDVFQVDQDNKSVTIRTIFGDPEKTLDHELVKNFEFQVVQVLEKAGFPLKQG